MFFFKKHKGLAIEDHEAITKFMDLHQGESKFWNERSKDLIRRQQRQLFAQIYDKLNKFDQFLFKKFFSKKSFKFTVWLLKKYFRKRVQLIKFDVKFKIEYPGNGYFFDKVIVYGKKYNLELSHFGDIAGLSVLHALAVGGSDKFNNGTERYKPSDR